MPFALPKLLTIKAAIYGVSPEDLISPTPSPTELAEVATHNLSTPTTDSSLSSFDITTMTRPSSESDLSSDDSSDAFWISARPTRLSRMKTWRLGATAWRRRVSKHQIAVLVLVALGLFIWFGPPPGSWQHRRPAHLPLGHHASSILTPHSNHAGTTNKNLPDPLAWLAKNSGNKHAVTDSGIFGVRSLQRGRPKAALISLVRNSELAGIRQSMMQLEHHWNHKYRYPWIFFNDEEFSEEFKVCFPLPTTIHRTSGVSSS